MITSNDIKSIRIDLDIRKTLGTPSTLMQARRTLVKIERLLRGATGIGRSRLEAFARRIRADYREAGGRYL